MTASVTCGHEWVFLPSSRDGWVAVYDPQSQAKRWFRVCRTCRTVQETATDPHRAAVAHSFAAIDPDPMVAFVPLYPESPVSVKKKVAKKATKKAARTAEILGHVKRDVTIALGLCEQIEDAPDAETRAQGCTELRALLTNMDARTGRRDPSTRKRA